MTVNVKLLSGIAVDEMLARYTAAGARHYLTDALGSVVAMLKDDASVQNYYAYSPYGETTPSAIDDGNSSEYTGRENDLTGVYYYRARYFDPVLKRFISADPIGLAGGLNFYAYVNGNPISRIDPLGLSDVTFDRSAGTITVYDNQSNQVGQYPAGNNTTSTSNGAWPDGTYGYSHYVPHPESGATGPFGSNGNFVFDVPGRTGMGIHSGRKGPQSKTRGCVRTTDDATDFLKGLNKTDPLKTITVK